MSDIKLFHLNGPVLTELTSASSKLEKALQTLFETHLETLVGVRFLASEYQTSNGGRMDTLGIDENGYPVIIKYKRQSSENVINQGLFYLDWLMDHRGDFELLVLKRFGKETAEAIEWSAPRLICIAADFTKYDTHAVNQMSRNIELIRYRRFGEELLMLDLLTAVSAPTSTITVTTELGMPGKYKTATENLTDAGDDLSVLYADVETYMLGLGDDVLKKTLKNYFAFKRIKNFACVEIKTQLKAVRLFLKIDPTTVELENGYTRDVRNLGHFGTGDLEVTLKTPEDFDKAKPLILQSYEAS